MEGKLGEELLELILNELVLPMGYNNNNNNNNCEWEFDRRVWDVIEIRTDVAVHSSIIMESGGKCAKKWKSGVADLCGKFNCEISDCTNLRLVSIKVENSGSHFLITLPIWSLNYYILC